MGLYSFKEKPIDYFHALNQGKLKFPTALVDETTYYCKRIILRNIVELPLMSLTDLSIHNIELKPKSR